MPAYIDRAHRRAQLCRAGAPVYTVPARGRPTQILPPENTVGEF